MKTAVVSCNNNSDYLFYLPCVCESWFKLGYHVALMKPNNFEVSQYTLEVIQTLTDKYNCEFTQISFNLIEGIDEVTLTQCSRLFAAYHLEGKIITSDIDMLVMKDIFKGFGSMDVYGKDLTGEHPNSHYPMCYISLDAHKWRELMDIDRTSTLEFNMQKVIKQEPWHNSEVQAERWCTDQEIVTKRLLECKGFVYHHDRGIDPNTGYPYGRLDRANWTYPNEIIDVHLPRNPIGKYHMIAPLVGEWFQDYYNKWQR